MPNGPEKDRMRAELQAKEMKIKEMQREMARMQEQLQKK